MNTTIHMPRHAEEIIERLQKHGYEAYIVGGCVRDSMIGREPGDWDITTSATPWQVKQVFGRTIDTGIQHGTVTIMRGKEGYETGWTESMRMEDIPSRCPLLRIWRRI